MARNPVTGIDLTAVAWKTVEEVYGDVGFQTVPGELVCVLTEDAQTGGSTVLVKLPAGWGSDAPERHSCLQEEVLLEGDLTIAGVELVAPAYLGFPPGFPHGPVSTRDGCIVLATHDGPIDVEYLR